MRKFVGQWVILMPSSSIFMSASTAILYAQTLAVLTYCRQRFPYQCWTAHNLILSKFTHPAAISRTATSVICASPSIALFVRSGRCTTFNDASVTGPTELLITWSEDDWTSLSINHVIQKRVFNSPLTCAMSTILRTLRDHVNFASRLRSRLHWLAVLNAITFSPSSNSNKSNNNSWLQIRDL